MDRRSRVWLSLVLSLALAAACTPRVDQGLSDIKARQAAGDVEGAEKELRSVLAEAPDNAEARYLLGQVLVSQGREAEAVYPLSIAADGTPYAKQAKMLLASLYLKDHNFEEAIRETESVLAEDPEDTAALVMRTHAALSINHGETALDSVQRLRTLHPEEQGYRALEADALAQSGKLGKAEALYKKILASDWGGEAERGLVCDRLALFYHAQLHDDERSAKQLHACVESTSGSLAIVGKAANQLDEMKRPAEAVDLLRQAMKLNPEELGIRKQLATRLIAQDKLDEALGLLEEVATNSPSLDSLAALADIQRRLGKPEEALKSLEEARGHALEPAATEQLDFSRASVLVEMGRLDDAEKLAAGFHAALYRQIIDGQVALARGDAKHALDLFDRALTQWPDNPALRDAAARAALALGDEDRALAEFREVTRHASSSTDAALELAVLYLAQGRYEFAESFAERHIGFRGLTGPDAHLVKARAELALGKRQEYLKTLDDLAARDDGRYRATAFAELAKVAGQRRGPERGLALIAKMRQAKPLDLSSKEARPLLRILLKLNEEAGHQSKAFAIADELVAAHPHDAGLVALRGQVLLDAGRKEDAAHAFAKALDLDPADAHALAGQGQLLYERGKLSEAQKLFDRAASAEPLVGQYAYLGAQMSLLAGNRQDAKSRLERIVQVFFDNAGAANDLAWLLADSGGDLERAAVLARRAVRLEPRAETLDTLGYVRLQSNKLDAAEAILRRALKLKPDYATARYHLGVVLARKGKGEEAQRELEAALAIKPFPEAEKARTELAQLQSGA